MPIFVVDSENNILACASEREVQEAADTTAVETFSSEKELARLAANWPGSRPAEIWNNFAGAVPFDDLKPVARRPILRMPLQHHRCPASR